MSLIQWGQNELLKLASVTTKSCLIDVPLPSIPKPLMTTQKSVYFNLSMSMH